MYADKWTRNCRNQTCIYFFYAFQVCECCKMTVGSHVAVCWLFYADLLCKWYNVSQENSWLNTGKKTKTNLFCLFVRVTQFDRLCFSHAWGLPVAIFPSAAAGPSGITLLTCRNSSGSSPPIIVKPKPMLLFWSDVDKKLPFSWVGSRVNSGFSVKDTYTCKLPKHKYCVCFIAKI